MKKKIFALMLVFTLLLSFVLVLGSCKDTGDTTGGEGNNGGDLTVNENVPGTGGTPSIDVVTNPDSSDAQAGEEDNYLHN